MQDLERIQDLFMEALEQPNHIRAEWLRKACVGNEVLYTEVFNLLQVASQAHDAFGESGSEFFEPLLGQLETELEGKDWVGRQIGRYFVQKLLGHGGMGAVFLAEEHGAVTRRVALKIVRRGMDTDHMIRRFRTERTVLGALNHPNIARLIDAGVTAEGQPFFVMEYIKGKPINTHCDDLRLRVDERLQVFLPVLEAVGFAHQNQVIHRDLKPGNILINDLGEVKLLDFGIAKVLDPKRYNLSFSVTQTELRLLTPEYASPEQIAGREISPAADVYQLGVLLYELITGHRPYSLGKVVSKFEMARIILEEPPTRPSSVIEKVVKLDQGRKQTIVLSPEEITKSRRTTVERLKHRLTGDLEFILNKALEKKPEDRYKTAEAFAEDIWKHLRGEPLREQSGGFWKKILRKGS
ncbi:MAG: serine/threonine protein kinase [Bacteroidetes Order II. Incertae sedis bacterium]|nr:serine/threonine protein kinase [Bacteroidetes Order II. bacterium]